MLIHNSKCIGCICAVNNPLELQDSVLLVYFREHSSTLTSVISLSRIFLFILSLVKVKASPICDSVRWGVPVREDTYPEPTA